MATTKTEQNTLSENNNILLDQNQQELNAFLNEDDNGYTKRRRVMDAIYQKSISNDKDSLYAGNSLLDRDMGKATERKDITSGGRPVEMVKVDILSPEIFEDTSE